MDRLTTIKAAACTAAAALTAFWGWTGWLAAAWFLAMLLDYATGSAAALRAGTWSSRAAREGLWHKAGSVAGVLVAALLDFALRVLLGSVPGLGIDYDVLVVLAQIRHLACDGTMDVQPVVLELLHAHAVFFLHQSASADHGDHPP